MGFKMLEMVICQTQINVCSVFYTSIETFNVFQDECDIEYALKVNVILMKNGIFRGCLRKV